MALGGNLFALGAGGIALGSFGRSRNRGAGWLSGSPSCLGAAFDLCADAAPQKSPAASQAVRTNANWNRRFITWFLYSNLRLTQPLNRGARKARQIWKSHRNFQAPANPESFQNLFPWTLCLLESPGSIPLDSSPRVVRKKAKQKEPRAR